MGVLRGLTTRGREVASATVVALFAGAVVAMAVASPGEATADLELNDSGVWVTRTSTGELGRFNSRSGAVDGTLLAPSASFDVHQEAKDVLLEDAGTSVVAGVDVARLTLGAAVALPVGAQVAMRSGTIAVLDEESGDLWVAPRAELDALDLAETDPIVTLNGPAALTVGDDGTAHVAVATDGIVLSVPVDDGAVGSVREEALDDVAPSADLDATTVGDEVVVLDRTASALHLPGGDRVDLAGGSGARLQQSGEASDVVLVATGSSLVSQPLDGGEATVRSASGEPAAPVHVAGCAYGAWAGSGTVVRDCPGTDFDVERTVDGLDAGAGVAYRVNRDVVVLNELASGTLWVASEDFEVIDEWEQTTPEQAQDGEEAESDDTAPEAVDSAELDRSGENRPPKASDDQFGVRSGRATILPVLGNDIDPDGDVMVATLTGNQPSVGAVTPVLDGAALQITVPDDASGSSTLTYTVDDGRGGKDTGEVGLTVVPPEKNSAPEQVSEPVLTVARGGSGSIDVVPYFLDPDGDDVYLADAAATTPGDRVDARPDGSVEFQDGGSSTGRKEVTLVVADGNGGTFSGTLWIDVQGGENVPPVAVQDHVVARVGEPITVAPLVNDTDADGDDLRLANVGQAPPATVVPAYEAGTFRFESSRTGSFDIAYQLTDGPSSTTGVVRIDVVDPVESDAIPIVVSDQALLPAGGSALVDVVANDSDPGGGVLVVQSVQVPDDAGIGVAVLGHRVLRVTETRRLVSPVTVQYTVSNGAQSAVGEVQIVPVPEPTRLRPPAAEPDEATVHVRDVTTIPVLRNDSHPDSLELTLDAELDQDVDPGVGEFFVSGGKLRFRAGELGGTAHAIYRVRDPNGQEDSAQVTVRVRDGEENEPPQPPDVEARVLAGGTVTVRPDLVGSDADGDSVQLTGIASAPTKGIATLEDGAITYESIDGLTGQDAFEFAVVDARGAVATGVVRVGISPAPATNQPPVAVDDVAVVRPGRTVAIDALSNDSDADGDPLALVPGTLRGGEALEAEVVGAEIVVTTPDEESSAAFYYSIEDTYAARATAAVSVEAALDAPLLPPVAVDDVVAAEEVLGQDAVEVDVLANDSDPDGTIDDLEVQTAADGATVSENGTITVPVTTRRQVITYTVTDVDGQVGIAFVLVPAGLVTPEDEQNEDEDEPRPAPVLRPGMPTPEVLAGEEIVLTVPNYVMAAEGRTPLLTGASSVSGVGGAAEPQDATTVVYRPAEDHVGRGAVSFEVTDGTSADDPDGVTALLTLPIDVLPPANEPPEPGSPTLEVAAGEESTVDLGRFADDIDGDELTFALEGAAPEGITLSLEGSRVVAQASPEVPKGSSATVAYTVSDGENEAVPGELGLSVVASTRPLPVAVDDAVEKAHQGEPQTVRVLDNDQNPFPEEALQLLGAVVETGDGTAEVSGDEVVATPGPDFVGVMVVRYQILDATNDADRMVEGRVQITVQGRPETPVQPEVVEVRSKTVVLAWEPPIDNGAPITSYTVRSSQGDTQECTATTCTIGGLTNDVEYTFTVSATNEVGESDESAASPIARPDERPDQPASPNLEFGDGSLTVTWKNASYSDRSAIESVNLRISPAPPSGADTKIGVTGTSLVWDGLSNGTAYRVSVQAVNRAPEPSDWSQPSAAETPAGKPDPSSKVTAKRVDDPLGGRIVVDWTAAIPNGDAIDQYEIVPSSGASKTASGTSSSIEFTGLAVDKSYTFTVRAKNKAGWSSPSAKSNAITPYGKPGKPGTPKATLSDGIKKITVTWGAAEDNGSPVSYTVKSSSGATKSVAAGGSRSVTFTGSLDTSYSFTVTAQNAGGSATSSRSNTVTTKDVPSAPRSLTYKEIGSQPVTDGEYTWSTPSSNGGLSVDKYQWSGSANGEGNRRSVGMSAGYSKSYNLKVRAHNAAGWGPWTGVKYGSTDPRPTVKVGKGGNAQGSPGCATSGCRLLTVQISGAEPNTTFTATCNSSSTSGAWGTPKSFTTNGSGNLSAEHWCYYGKHGEQVWITTGKSHWGNNGASSKITW